MADARTVGRQAVRRQRVLLRVLVLATALCFVPPTGAPAAADSGPDTEAAQICVATTGPHQWQVEHLLGLPRDGQMSPQDCLAIQQAQERLGITPADGAADETTFQMLLAAEGPTADQPPADEPPAKPKPQAKPKPKRWMPPLRGKFRISARYHISGDWVAGYHTGIDLAAPTGTPVYAVGAGTVVLARQAGDYGRAVTLRLVDGHYVVYGHLSRVSVRPGAKVRAGTRVGYSGNTGRSSGPHLHFEVRSERRYGSDVDPVHYLARYGVRPRWSVAPGRAGHAFACGHGAEAARSVPGRR